MKTWKLERTQQCAKCPWRKDVDPHTIPDGYSVDKHRALKSTIADQENPCSSLRQQSAMACHETGNTHCIGWLMNQLGPGNNIGLRIAAISCENIKDVRTVGKQHARFEDTLPRPQKRRRS